MNIQEIKAIKLQDFLAKLGHNPTKHCGCNLWYLSPLRDEEHASFKVNTERNQWYDFGVGKGGNIFALAEMLYRSSDIAFLIKQIEQNIGNNITSLPYSIATISKQHTAVFDNLQVSNLSHPALIKYLNDRCININIANSICKELHYESNGKHYFGIGFPNIAGGYEFRNPFFKGCIAPKDLTIFQTGTLKKSCFLFEGFMDYLSYATIRKYKNFNAIKLNNPDYIILNSVTNIQKAKKYLTNYNSIQCFFDNDIAGKNAYQELSKELGIIVIDRSNFYKDYKDLNEYLCANFNHFNKLKSNKIKR